MSHTVAMKRRLMVQLLTLLAAVAAPLERYQSPPEFAKSGDFSFDYLPQLLVAQDYVYSDASVPGARHIVVLRHKDAQSGDLRSIEINMLRSLKQRLTCSDYAVCKTVKGVAIGTHSEDPEFQAALETVAGSFERR